MSYETKNTTRSGSRASIRRNQARRSASSELVEPGPNVEQELAQIWARLLAIPRVGSMDNFFELGGDSVIADRVLVEIEKRFGVHLPPATLVGIPTIDRLAEVVRAVQRAKQGPTRPPFLGIFADRMRTLLRLTP